MDDDESDLTAVHEAGHCVIAHALGHPVTRVGLDACDTLFRRGDHRMILGEAMIALAGPFSEIRFR